MKNEMRLRRYIKDEEALLVPLEIDSPYLVKELHTQTFAGFIDTDELAKIIFREED